MWTLETDDYGYACRIMLDGVVRLQLNPGTVVNEQHARDVVDALNDAAKLGEAGAGYSQQTMDAVVKEREELRAENTKLGDACEKAIAFVKNIHEFRTVAGEMPFGTIDYYGMEDLMAMLRAALGEGKHD